MPTMRRPDHEPLYVQIRSALVARIVSGEWKPGAMLPSDPSLATAMGVSLGTIRKTVDRLAADGVLRRHQGKGTFVTEQTPELANFHFFRLVNPHGERVLPQPVSETTVTVSAGPESAQALGIAIGETVVRIDRVRAIDGRPAILETVEVPAALMPGLERESPLPNALYPHYQARHGISVISTDDRLSAILADAAAANTLEIAENSPLLLVQRAAFDLTGRTVELRHSRFLSDGLAYAVTLG
jgi:GntR family transcriptional regulator